MPTPEVPEPAYAGIDSFLMRRFGKEVANYFSGSPLNRVSFLRTDNNFLSSALKHPSATFLLFNNLAPLGKDVTQLQYVSYDDVQAFIGSNPYGKSEEETLSEYDSSVITPQLVFLGLNEGQETGFVWKTIYRGSPCFALDVTPRSTLAPMASKLVEQLKARNLQFLEGRMNTSLPAPDAAIYAQARALLDWNSRNPFCAGCGQPTLSINAGHKRTCPPKDRALLKGASVAGLTASDSRANRPDCASRRGVSNLSFPRTDPTIIVAVVSADGERVLLGRQKRWPKFWYSTLAGFIEPGESVEEAVRREVWEESGVILGRVVIQSTQPWPYPANLMIGAIAQTVVGKEDVVLQHDPELEDAKWVSLQELRDALNFGTSNLGEAPGPEYKEGALRLPPRTAIAYQLLLATVELLDPRVNESKI